MATKPTYFIVDATKEPAKNIWPNHPNDADFVIRGYCYGNPNFRDGEWIRSSIVVDEDKEKGHFVTRNSVYVSITKEQAKVAQMLVPGQQ